MGARNAIGIDPDSEGFVCAYVKVGEAKVTTKSYLTSDADVERFLRWVEREGEIIVAIEGSNGLSKPIEKALREGGIIFYSFKPADTDKFRKAVLGQNKNNARDAESVARYAMALESQGKLDQWRRVWFPDAELQLLSRSYERTSRDMTAATNRLWKLLRQASPDLYLALKGNNPEVSLEEQVLTGQAFLSLLSTKPNLGEWKSLSQDQVFEAMGGRNYVGRGLLIEKLQKLAPSSEPTSPAITLLIENHARQILRFKQEELSMTKMLEDLIKDSHAARALLEIRGIATITASAMMAEIIDIRRFAREDSLACYCGLGLKEHSTGKTVQMIPTPFFNHRLKDAFMTAARNFVRYNPDSHLSGYYRNLVKKGMSTKEATKRVARALVRVIFKRLTSLIETETHEVQSQKCEEGESDMANGNGRGEDAHPSNMSLSSLLDNTTRAKQVNETPLARKTGDKSMRRKRKGRKKTA